MQSVLTLGNSSYDIFMLCWNNMSCFAAFVCVLVSKCVCVLRFIASSSPTLSANHFSCNHPHNKLFRKPWNPTLLLVPTPAVIPLKHTPPLSALSCAFRLPKTLQCNQITSLKLGQHLLTAPVSSAPLTPPCTPDWKSSAFVHFKIWRVLLHFDRDVSLCSPPQSWLNVHLVCRPGPH